MTFKSTLAPALAAALFGLPAFATDISVHDAYARSSGASAKSGAAFMMLENAGTTDDRLIAVHTDAAARAELHTHKESENGVMQMVHVEDGIPVPAGGMHLLARGGDHVMLMGLAGPLQQGDMITLTLTFEQAGDITVDLPVDNERKASH